jgi:uncharacterized protein (DUF427 family)
MSLTTAHGPLAAESPSTVNYRTEGPPQRLFLSEFPRRVRAVFADHTIVDTVSAALLHQTGRLPQLYVPQTEVQGHLLRPSDTSDESPFTGAYRYHHVVVGDRIARDAVWSLPSPPAEAAWLAGWHGIAFDAMDAWYDEAEEVHGHLRDPYHRVDTVATTRRIRVRVGGTVLADSLEPLLVSETGLPNQLYVPPADVDTDELTPSTTTTQCPYKGTAHYADAAGITAVAWRYRHPLPEAARIAGYWCFDPDKVTIESDSRRGSSEHPERARKKDPYWL